VKNRKNTTDHEYLSKLIQSWTGYVLLMGAILFPALEFMDYFISVENFKRFIVYRFVAAAGLVLLYFLNRLKQHRMYQYAISLAGTTLCAATIEIAVLQSGGQDSPYYAAMLILAICCLGFVPISLSFSFVLVGAVYLIYLVPILLTETITGGLFISNNAFLLSTFVIGLLLRYNNQKLIMTELQLKSELADDKHTLELYSGILKDQVDVKTGELAITDQRYRALFDHANDGIVVLDRNGTITDANLRFCELHGFSSGALLGTNYRLLEIGSYNKEVAERLIRILAGESLVYEAEHFRRDGSRIALEVSARAIDIGGVPHVQAFLRDISEKRRLQEQVLQSQKMESMGVLAGGIAHDFNNTLTAILGHAEVLRRQIKADETTNRRIRTIEDAARRAGKMITKLLSFARKESLNLAPTDLNAVVRITMELLGRSMVDHKIKVRLSLDENIPSVMGDAIHLEQVIANIVLNSVDAMPGGGNLTIITSRVMIGPDAASDHPFLNAGEHVSLSIHDSGKGISPEIRGRIFDPFFTTKPAGKGTGLGLAMVYGIVKNHCGDIRVMSEENDGTTFTISLPAACAEPVRQERAPEALPARVPARGGNILIVEDEQDILTSVGDILEHHGYLVFLAEDPAHARDLFDRNANEIDLVITDIAMPVTNGVELARSFKSRRPDVKVIGISARDKRAISQGEQLFDGYVRKPFDGPALLMAVRRVLDDRDTISRDGS